MQHTMTNISLAAFLGFNRGTQPVSVFLFPPADHNMHTVSRCLVQFLTDRLQNADDVADVAIRILHAHVYKTAIVGDAVKLSMHLYAAGPEFFANIPWEDDIGTALICRMNDGIKYIFLIVPITFLFPLKLNEKCRCGQEGIWNCGCVLAPHELSPPTPSCAKQQRTTV